MTPHPITYEQACSYSTEAFVWCAHLRSGVVIWEQPGVSSDSVPGDSVWRLDYVPCRRPDLPRIECYVDLRRGERFVRYWTTIWSPTDRGTERLYVLGIESDGRHALLCYYPGINKLVLSAKRPFHPSWTAEPFQHLPTDSRFIGGPQTSHIGWLSDGFGGLVDVLPDRRLTFRTITDA